MIDLKVKISDIINKPSDARTMPTNLNTQELLESLVGELRNTNHRIDTIVKNQEEQRSSIDLLHSERDLLEDIVTYQRELKSILEFFKQHQKQDSKEIQIGIDEVKDAISETVPQIKEEVLQNLDQAIEVIKRKRGLDFKTRNVVWYKKLWAFLKKALSKSR